MGRGIDWQLFTPREGWRGFAGEVGVIVIGVLIALGAQQLVDRWQMSREIAVFRETIDHEIALNLFVYDDRARSFACSNRTLDELETWLASARSGASVPGISMTGSTGFFFYRSAWANRNAEVYANLPSAIRLKYAEFYDELENNDRLREAERSARVVLLRYAEPGPLSLAERREISAAVQVIRRYTRLFEENGALSQKIGRDLGVASLIPDGVTAEELAADDTCVKVDFIAPSQ